MVTEKVAIIYFAKKCIEIYCGWIFFGKSYWTDNNTSQNNFNVPLTTILSEMLATPTKVTSGKGVNLTALTTGSNPTTLPTSFLTRNPVTGDMTPMAYINWILLDEQFKYVPGGVGFSRVGAANAIYNHNDLQNIPVTVNGYLYIYCSNQSPVKVFFDNLQVIYTHGPLIEETHYYPFGLTMAGISSSSFRSSSPTCGCPKNKKGFNGNEIQNKEFDDASGLEVYDFNTRTYDQQIGRFIQVDPLVLSEDFLEEKEEVNGGAFNLNNLQVYAFAYNNPLRYKDPDGKCQIVSPQQSVLV